ncbi:DNAH1 [Symbiodinium sp. CCMP2592]|nr:DNAH1 [Symbiodinium sp. CCMP2592]
MLELALAGCGRRLLEWLCCGELLALRTAGRLVEIHQEVLQAASWSTDHGRWLGALKERPFPVDRALDCFQQWRGAVIQSSWTSDTSSEKRQDATLCCWPVLRRLALKPQYITNRLPGAPSLGDLLADGGSELLCLALDSRTHRYASDEEPLGELSMQTLLLATSLSAGGLILLQHRLMTLDSCRGSPDSPGGLEHATQVTLSPGLDALLHHLLAEDPLLLRELRSTLKLPIPEAAQKSFQPEDMSQQREPLQIVCFLNMMALCRGFAPSVVVPRRSAAPEIRTGKEV